MFPADASMTFIPVLTEPVNITLPTRGSRTRASPTSPAPVTAVSTPGGSASLRTAAMARPVSVVYSLGFWTTALPIRSAGAICQQAMIIGQFHGVMAPTTPIGR